MSGYVKGLLRAAEICAEYERGQESLAAMHVDEDGNTDEQGIPFSNKALGAQQCRADILKAIRAEASQPASQPDSVAVPVSLMQSWHDFWANYSSLNEDCQDDLNEKRHQVLDEMLRAAKEPK
jgi:hypothetical protein